MVSLGDETVFYYLRERVSGRGIVEQQIGISIPKLELLKLAVGRTGARRETLLIEFSKDDRVLAAGVAHWQEDVGFGANIQLFITVTPTTNTTELRERWSTESWAMGLLTGPIGMVDLSHDPDAGDSGLRFSGMPKPDHQWPTRRRGRR